MAPLVPNVAAGDNRAAIVGPRWEGPMRRRRQRNWLAAAIGGLAALTLAGVVQSGVAKMKEASDRVH